MQKLIISNSVNKLILIDSEFNLFIFIIFIFKINYCNNLLNFIFKLNINKDK